jgi:HNH endonuclease
MKEEWRKVPELPDRFEVSNFGRRRILSFIDRAGDRHKPVLRNYNQNVVGIRINGKLKFFRIAELILLTFVGPKPFPKAVARHLDDDKQNNHLDNLAWGSYGDNMRDAYRNGKRTNNYAFRWG